MAYIALDLVILFSFSDRMCMTDFTVYIVLGIDYSYSIMWCVYEISISGSIIPLLAGSLLLAHDGVCVIENLGSLKKDVREILKKGM